MRVWRREWEEASAAATTRYPERTGHFYWAVQSTMVQDAVHNICLCTDSRGEAVSIGGT